MDSLYVYAHFCEFAAADPTPPSMEPVIATIYGARHRFYSRS